MKIKRIIPAVLALCLCTSNVFAASVLTESYTLHTTEAVSAEVSDLGKGIFADVPASIEKDGRIYHAVSVSADVLQEEKRAQVKRTFTNAVKADLPKTVKRNGKTLKLEKGSIEETVIVRDAVTGSHTWTGCSSKPDIPESLELTTDSGLTVTGYLQNVTSSHSNTLAEYEMPATFIGDADCQYYVINGKRIPNTFEEPTFEGYEKEILTYLNLSAGDYTITGGKWTSGYVKENGQTVRHAVFTCSADVLTDYTAYYAESLTEASPGYSTTDITAVYSNGIEDTEYDIAVTVDYEREGLPVKVIVIITGAALLILAGLIAAILMLIRKKKDEKEE